MNNNNISGGALDKIDFSKPEKYLREIIEFLT